MSLIYSHPAYGQLGKKFTVYKIRTMTGSIDATRDAQLSLSGVLDKSDKERITILGRILRPLGLDETPQLYNILVRHNMQFIGIRPFLIEEFDLLPASIQKRLLEEKPGLIPAESYYIYKVGDYNSRVDAIEKYLDENPKGLKRVKIGLIALARRLLRYSNR